MKFRDIQQFPHANYSVNVPWNYLNNWLKNKDMIINDDPIYQRGYKWTIFQKSSYIEFILKDGRSARDIYFNSKNWDAFKNNEKKLLELVDGKQRLNAVIEFLDNKVPVFNGNYFKDFEDELPSMVADFKIYVNQLQTDLEVVDWYLAMNTGGSIHTEEDLKSAIEYKNQLKKIKLWKI